MHPLINYSQSWEDPAVLREALRIGSVDTVLSVTSGGDNTLALLLDSPAHIVSIDSNASQTDLLRLKIVALRSLSYEELLTFLGYRHASAAARAIMAAQLSPGAASSELAKAISGGIAHGGKFERFLLRFSSVVLPLIHSRSEVRAFCDSTSLDIQQEIFQKRWNTLRWRIAFRLVAAKAVLRAFARQSGMFTYVRERNVAVTYRARFEQNFMTIPLRDNHFMRYLLLGKDCGTVPDCFKDEAIALIRARSGRVDAVTGDILEHLRSVAPQSYSRYNLSDVFEALSEVRRVELWREIVRTSKDGARVAFWENLAPVSVPQHLRESVIEDCKLGGALRVKDRAPFYGAFRIFTIHP